MRFRSLGVSQHYLSQLSGFRISTITVVQTGTPFSVGNTSGPSYAYDNSLGIDGGGTGTPAFPTPSAGAQTERILAQASVRDGSLYRCNLD